MQDELKVVNVNVVKLRLLYLSWALEIQESKYSRDFFLGISLKSKVLPHNVGICWNSTHHMLSECLPYWTTIQLFSNIE